MSLAVFDSGTASFQDGFNTVMTELKLRLQEENIERTVTVDQEVFIIGRSPQCDLYLPSGGVSRCHARLTKTITGVWTIEDLGSKNGTQINDHVVISPQELHHGDTIWLGDVSLPLLRCTKKRVHL